MLGKREDGVWGPSVCVLVIDTRAGLEGDGWYAQFRRTRAPNDAMRPRRSSQNVQRRSTLNPVFGLLSRNEPFDGWMLQTDGHDHSAGLGRRFVVRPHGPDRAPTSCPSIGSDSLGQQGFKLLRRSDWLGSARSGLANALDSPTLTMRWSYGYFG
jgi:hypothetical protein